MVQISSHSGSELNSVQAGDILIGYREYGTGHPLVMIQGYGSTMELWERHLLDPLAKHFRVIVYDLRGVGATEEGTSDFTIHQFAEDALKFMEALDLEGPFVLGWSMGGLIAQELALNHPHMVEKLILYSAHCSSLLHPPTIDLIDQLCDLTGTDTGRNMRSICLLFPDPWAEENSIRVNEIFDRPRGKIPVSVLNKQAATIESWNGTCDRLGDLVCPTLIVHGRKDILTPYQNSVDMAERIPDSELVIFEDSGHGLMFQEPDNFAQVIVEFLEN